VGAPRLDNDTVPDGPHPCVRASFSGCRMLGTPHPPTRLSPQPGRRSLCPCAGPRRHSGMFRMNELASSSRRLFTRVVSGISRRITRTAKPHRRQRRYWYTQRASLWGASSRSMVGEAADARPRPRDDPMGVPIRGRLLVGVCHNSRHRVRLRPNRAQGIRRGPASTQRPRLGSRSLAHTSSAWNMQSHIHLAPRAARRGLSLVESRGWMGCGGEISVETSGGTHDISERLQPVGGWRCRSAGVRGFARLEAGIRCQLRPVAWMPWTRGRTWRAGRHHRMPSPRQTCQALLA